MERLWNYLRGLFNMVAEVDSLRADVQFLQDKDSKRDLHDQDVVAVIRELTQKMEHKQELHAAETRALKAELEAILLRFERRLPPAS
jgi:hypothetical protein